MTNERWLKNYLTDRGYDAHLTRGSRGPFDIIAYRKSLGGLSNERWLIQVKATNADSIRIDRDEAHGVVIAGDKAGAHYAYAIRFGRQRWRIFRDPLRHSMQVKAKEGDISLDVEMGHMLEDVFG
jgi:Holliday junction resolvase